MVLYFFASHHKADIVCETNQSVNLVYTQIFGGFGTTRSDSIEFLASLQSTCDFYPDIKEK